MENKKQDNNLWKHSIPMYVVNLNRAQNFNYLTAQSEQK